MITRVAELKLKSAITVGAAFGEFVPLRIGSRIKVTNLTFTGPHSLGIYWFTCEWHGFKIEFQFSQVEFVEVSPNFENELLTMIYHEKISTP